MAANSLFSGPFVSIVSADGEPVVGAKIYVYAAGTMDSEPVYHDSDLGDAWTQPIETNAAGQTDGPVYVSPVPALKIVVVDADDVPVPGYPVDDWSPSAVAS